MKRDIIDIIFGVYPIEVKAGINTQASLCIRAGHEAAFRARAVMMALGWLNRHE